MLPFRDRDAMRLAVLVVAVLLSITVLWTSHALGIAIAGTSPARAGQVTRNRDSVASSALTPHVIGNGRVVPSGGFAPLVSAAHIIHSSLAFH